MLKIENNESGELEVKFDLTLKQYKHRPTKVFACKMEEEFEVQTREGIMHGEPGDYVVYGVRGEWYPVKPEVFELAYKEVK
jgi:hypothetical protein